MDTFWIVVAIILTGCLTAAAIDRNSRLKLAVTDKEEYSPEYMAQARASLDNFNHINDVLDIKIRIAENKLNIKNLPNFISIWKNESDGDDSGSVYLTHIKKIYEESRNNGVDNIKLVSNQVIISNIKDKIEGDMALLQEIEDDYSDKQKEYLGYHPENLEITKNKYKLNEPFLPDFDNDYYNEDNTSPWSIYEERKVKLKNLESALAK